MHAAADSLLDALLRSVAHPALRTEAVAVARALGRVYAGPGQVGLSAGNALDALHIADLAAQGLARVEVYPRPTVAVFSFGSALLHAGDLPAPGRCFDAASPMLQALLSGCGIESLAWPALAHEPARIDAALGDALDSFDVVLFTATAAAAETLLARLPRLGVAMPIAGSDAPRAWRSARARLLWLQAQPLALQAQFNGWVRPLLAALQYLQRDRADAASA